MHTWFSMCRVSTNPLHQLYYVIIVTSITEKYYYFHFMDDNTEAQGTYLPKVWQLLISSAEMAI